VSDYANTESQGYQNRLLDSFFELCIQYNAFVKWAEEMGKDKEAALDLRDKMNGLILERLRACREDKESATEQTWETPVDFEMIRP
jgi:hypothetical protein